MKLVLSAPSLLGIALAVALLVALFKPNPRANRRSGQDQGSDRLLLLGIGCLALLFFIGQGSQAILQRDEAVFVVTNRAVADGNLPFVAAFDNTGPLGQLWGGFGVAAGELIGLNAVEGARLAYLPVALVAVLLLYRLGLRAGLERSWAAVGGISLLVLSSDRSNSSTQRVVSTVRKSTTSKSATSVSATSTNVRASRISPLGPAEAGGRPWRLGDVQVPGHDVSRDLVDRTPLSVRMCT